MVANAAANANDDIGDSAAKLIEKGIQGMEKECKRLRLTTRQKSCDRILFEVSLRLGYAVTWFEILYGLRAFREAVEDALGDCIFIAIPQDKGRYIVEPGTMFVDIDAYFPMATGHLETAGKCLASGFHDACVFHCMNALEFGLRSLTAEIGTTFKAEVEVENWKNIIDAIEADIRKETKRIEQDDPKGLEKLAKLKTHADTAMQFRYFKDAWRNHVAHGRDSYDEHQAETILTHVADFTRLLIQRGLFE